MKRKIKELKQKSKLELEIKENQVRSLKLKIEQQEELIRDLESIEKPDTSIADKKQKLKLRSMEKLCKRSLSALQAVSCSLSSKNPGGSIDVSKNEEYKQGMDILGVSLDELDQFMNPQNLTKNEARSVERILQKFESGDTSVEEIEMVQEYCMRLINN